MVNPFIALNVENPSMAITRQKKLNGKHFIFGNFMLTFIKKSRISQLRSGSEGEIGGHKGREL